MKNIYIILFLFFIGCNNYKFDNKSIKKHFNQSSSIQLDKILKSQNKFAFIKENNNSIEEGTFGDIYIYNLNDSCTYRVTNDSFYEEWLSWSPDGTKLLFTSTRENKYPYKEPIKTFNNSLFIFDLTNGEIIRLNKSNNELNKISNYNGLKWLKSGIYFSDSHEIIYRINEKGDSLTKIVGIEKDYNIMDFSISFDSKYIAFECEKGLSATEFRIGFVNLLTKELTWVDSCKKAIYTGGWSFDNESFLFSNPDKLYLYNIIKKGKTLLTNPDNEKLMVTKSYFLNPNKLISLSMENIYKVKIKNIRMVSSERNIQIWDLQKSEIKSLFNDGSYKKYLTPYYQAE